MSRKTKRAGGSPKHPERIKAGRSIWKQRVAAAYGYRCYDCGVMLVIISSVPPGYRIRETGHWLTYYDPIMEDVVSERIFTVEHLLEISKGGKTEISNLRPACKSCNQRHSSKYTDKNPRPPRLCHMGCGRQVFKKRTCRACHKANAAKYFDGLFRSRMYRIQPEN